MNTAALALKARMGSSGELSIRLQGNCMEPLLKAGDLARIIPAAKTEVGRVYLLELPNGSIALHRVIVLCDDGIMSKGDYSSMYEVLSERSIVGMLAAVRLSENGPWHDFENHGFTRRVSAALSRCSVYDKRLGKESRFHKKTRRMCKRALAFFSRQRRRSWQS